jgi:cell division transport system ATP-binding protein
MITFENVSKYYSGGIEALTQVSFKLLPGEMAFLTGHSGAGKSTLLKLCLLMERQTQGKIIINGKSLKQISKRLIPYHRRGIGVIFQKPKLLFDRTVLDNVGLPLVIAGFRHQDIRRRARAAIDKVGLLSKERTYPRLLSEGEQQRVGIARAIVHKPPLLLADEPTGNLDPELSTEIMRLFEQLNHLGMSMLIASHDQSLISTLRHRILVLKKGRLL